MPSFETDDHPLQSIFSTDVRETAGSAGDAITGAATAMDSSSSSEMSLKGQKEAIKGGLHVGATAPGGMLGKKLGGLLGQPSDLFKGMY
jgi:hypothetical protein